MLAPSFFISPKDLWFLIGTPQAPHIIDVRRRDIYESTPGVLRVSRYRDLASDHGWGRS